MSHIEDVLTFLGYDQSPACLRPQDRNFQSAPRIGHILRSAASELNLKAAYVLHPSPGEKTNRAPIPAVYVCSAKNEKAADALHRKIWNQDIAPFIIISSPGGIKLYSGFRHRQTLDGNVQGQLSEFTSLDDAATILHALDARSIDNGSLWRERREDVYWRDRLNRRLLNNLLRVDQLLQADDLDRNVAHSLIGKYVYLRYLRDRNILSDRKLERWGVEPEAVFGRNARVGAFAEVNHHLDDWLNGSVFPLKLAGKHAPKAKHIRMVSGIFEGDDVFDGGETQLSLDFQDYDFSHIPIETLSLVYEQFLHQGKSGEAKAKGAYYTPIPVVNMMLSEMEESHPLERGMKVVDPSCGSGAFLVQAYRQLVEREFPPKSSPKPGDLRDLLERHIFGVDIDADACNVTELSLLLTLLDYLTPPDLEDRRRAFKLPTLRNKNIFNANFFDEWPEQFKQHAKTGFDWVVGNPPWKQLSEKKLTKEDRPVWNWIVGHARDKPVGSNQSARAFVWKCGEILRKSGKASLFIPAMTLHDNPAQKFRKQFFTEYKVSTIADLSNLAEVISDGRFRVPGASLFFEHQEPDHEARENDLITYYAPKVANQELTRPQKTGQRIETWDLLINGSEIRDVPAQRAQTGDGLVWKTAMWGSHLDERLIERLSNRFLSIANLEDTKKIILKQGPELKPDLVDSSMPYPTEYCEEIVGKDTLDTSALGGMRHLFEFPGWALTPNENHYVDLRAGKSKLEICRGPHVVVSAARNFAVYLDDYLIVPSRQIGIVSPTGNKNFLKALSLYLSSDFALYHQFFISPQAGTKREVSTLKSLRQLPIAIADLSDEELSEWAALHQRLVKSKPSSDGNEPDLFNQSSQIEETSESLTSLIAELNQRTSDVLRLTKQEQSQIHDLLHVRLGLRDGKIEDRAVSPPSKPELRAYAQVLKKTLDDFLGEGSTHSHHILVVPDEDSGMVSIELLKRPKKSSAKVAVRGSNPSISKLSQQLLKKRSQWVYFNRNFRLYEKDRTLIMKPLQRFHWTHTQAILDAQSLIAETLTEHPK